MERRNLQQNKRPLDKKTVSLTKPIAKPDSNGHGNRPPPHPIASYGIILSAKNTGRFLICQRRDTIEYTEFVRGRVPKSLYRVYFSQMTQTERDRLLRYTFIQLWDDLWVNHNNRFYREVYPNAKAKYTEVYPSLPALLEAYPSAVKAPSWGFPKGKLNYSSEKHERAALREFIEETCIRLDYKNLLDIPYVTETFVGTNGKLYSTTYLIAQVDQETPIAYSTPNAMRPNTVSEEIADLKWVSLEQSRVFLNERRQAILEEVKARLEEFSKRPSPIEVVTQ